MTGSSVGAPRRLGHPVDTPEQLTSAWLSEALGRPVGEVTPEQVGAGQMGACYRLVVDDPASETGVTRLLAKLPTPDVGMRAIVAGAYRSEVRFYTELAATVAIRAPRCHAVVPPDDEGRFTLLLDEVAGASPGDQLAGCTAAQAEDAAVNLAGLHGPRWCDPDLLELGWVTRSGPEDAKLLAELFGPTTDSFVAQLDGLLSPQTVATIRGCVEVAEQWSLARADRFGLVHGDYRLDNLLFPDDGAPGVVAIDWQTLSLGLPARDLAYLVGTGLEPAVRRAAERDVVAAYHRALVGHGVTGYDLDLCWEDYRFAMLQGPLVAVFGCAYGARSERGDRMFAAMVERSCRAIEELGTLGLAAGG